MFKYCNIYYQPTNYFVYFNKKYRTKVKSEEVHVAQAPPKKRKLASDSQNKSTADPIENTTVDAQSSKKKKDLERTEATPRLEDATANTSSATGNQSRKKKKKKKKKVQQQQTVSTPAAGKKARKLAQIQGLDISDERLQAYGLNPKKFKNSLKYGKASHSKA